MVKGNYRALDLSLKNHRKRAQRILPTDESQFSENSLHFVPIYKGTLNLVLSDFPVQSLSTKVSEVNCFQNAQL